MLLPAGLLVVSAIEKGIATVREYVTSGVWELLQVVAVFAIAYVLAQLFVRLFGRRISQRFERPSLARTTIRGAKATIYLIALFSVLRIYGFRLSQIALTVTVFTAVLGVILAPIVGSFISGIFLLADQPYEIGDMIEIADTGQRGFVEDITLRYTKVFTLDNTFVVVPNGTMRDRDVINYSAEDTRTRQSLELVVTYESDLAQARRLIESAARSVEGVIGGGPSIRIGSARYPASPTCYITAYGDHGVHLQLRYWVEEPYRLVAVRSEIQTEIWDRLDDADVEIAYPHSHLVFDETSGELPVSMRPEEATRRQ
ncbi:mechanosensitive ion channel family protein [Halapricum hydrolyticum]|uniref:Mechanosensitive ion channel family protein n=1 Tax=Halapricum hydrolyticum TaxID=2979991 RepID=A0AAE3ID76_9EURY|nr:mechanosensitive ion channel family protein [Halapricum hydrolyticum]MCU4717908.1 mechanosensitive ion channel family protein [Halapricum hydrolyticum]MCU4727073.1 mechanosensitive ion channel family protein [Halapricum hydrolyticum]